MVQEGFSVSRASTALALSHPLVSKQIKALEKDLGVDLFLRTGNRILGLTQAGQTLQDAARRTVLEADNFTHLRDEFVRRDSGRFVIATTHINAQYVLRSYIKSFLERYPRLQLVLRQGTPKTIAGWVLLGHADVGISALRDDLPPKDADLVHMPCFELTRCVMAPLGHPIFDAGKLTLESLAGFPIVTLGPETIGGRAVIGAFEEAGIKPNVVLTALDADVVKSYVELGLGLGILPTPAYEADKDSGLRIINASSLFASTETYLMLRRGAFLRDFILDFISWLSPDFDEKSVRSAVGVRRTLTGAPADAG